MKAKEVERLITCIEENLRASPSAGLKFVDLRRHKTRLVSKQNHVIFGRRGAGKTSLVGSIQDSEKYIYIYINLEDYKDITFPNILIRVLTQVFSQLNLEVRKTFFWFQFWSKGRKLNKRLRRIWDELREYLHDPDEELQEIMERNAYQRSMGASANLKAIGAQAGEKEDSSREVKRRLPKSKIEFLRIHLSDYKEQVQRVSEYLGEKPILLVLDDFYFVPKKTQPEFVDYFHRLTKGTSLFIKLATIKHRSKIYRRHEGQYIGAELGHDVFEIDMDYTLDHFEELQTFMGRLLGNALEAASSSLRIDDMFMGDGFTQLCLASGGVPRDFLSLFVNLANQELSRGNEIGKVQVTDAAISTLNSKLESMKEDSGDEDAILSNCLSHIKRFVYDEKRTNAFLISKDDLDSNSIGHQAIRELVDLRLIHLVDHNTSKAPSDGRRYEAYIIDVSLYDNSRPRSFTQVDPGHRDDKSRKDALRASPVFQLSRLSEVLPEAPQPAREDESDVEGEQQSLDLSFE